MPINPYSGTTNSQPANLGGSTYSPSFGGGFGGFLGDLYGSKYQIPNPTQTASMAIQGNLGNLGDIYNLSVGADTAASAGETAALQQGLPLYQQNVATASANTASELAGDVPADVQNLLQQQSAERGAASGMAPSSPNASSAYLRALGLTSLGLQQQGQQNLTTQIGETPLGPAFNPSSMFVTPSEQQAAALAAAKEAAAPDPEMAGVANQINSML